MYKILLLTFLFIYSSLSNDSANAASFYYKILSYIEATDSLKRIVGKSEACWGIVDSVRINKGEYVGTIGHISKGSKKERMNKLGIIYLAGPAYYCHYYISYEGLTLSMHLEKIEVYEQNPNRFYHPEKGDTIPILYKPPNNVNILTCYKNYFGWIMVPDSLKPEKINLILRKKYKL
jgi:hypothetical protein